MSFKLSFKRRILLFGIVVILAVLIILGTKIFVIEKENVMEKEWIITDLKGEDLFSAGNVYNYSVINFPASKIFNSYKNYEEKTNKPLLEKEHFFLYENENIEMKILDPYQFPEIIITIKNEKILEKINDKSYALNDFIFENIYYRQFKLELDKDGGIVSDIYNQQLDEWIKMSKILPPVSKNSNEVEVCSRFEIFEEKYFKIILDLQIEKNIFPITTSFKFQRDYYFKPDRFTGSYSNQLS